MELFDDLPLLRGIAEACDVQLSQRQIAQLRHYATLLLEEQRRVNLTGITDWQLLQIKLLGDALALVPLLRQYCPEQKPDGCYLLDVGTGAGIPGIPLKIALPSLRLALLESVGKKVAFLRQAISALALDNVTICHGRAEVVAYDPEYRGKFDLVTARGVAPLPVLLELCLPFLHPNGYGIFPKGQNVDQEIEASQPALRVLGASIIDIVTPPHPALATTRTVIVQLDRPVPSRYPRRPGIPQKRPITPANSSSPPVRKTGNANERR